MGRKRSGGGFLVVLLAVVRALLAAFTKPAPKTKPLRSRPQASRALRQTGKTFRHAVGESNYRPALAALADHQALPGLGMAVVATLVCESNNPHDANAVRVMIDGRTVGYLSRDDAENYRHSLRNSGLDLGDREVPARIAGGGPGKHYGVYLDLPDVVT